MLLCWSRSGGWSGGGRLVFLRISVGVAEREFWAFRTFGRTQPSPIGPIAEKMEEFCGPACGNDFPAHHETPSPIGWARMRIITGFPLSAFSFSVLFFFSITELSLIETGVQSAAAKPTNHTGI